MSDCSAIAKGDAPARGSRTLLLVDDEENILSSLRRLLRADGYTILTATSGVEGLDVMANQAVDVVLSDQRMPHMTGVEFLRKAKDLYPDTVRLVLSGYTDLQSVTDAINEGAVYKFLTKPWDDAMLRANIDEAFRRKALNDENRRLTQDLQVANAELAAINERLEAVLKQQRHRICLDERSLSMAQEALARLPVAVMGVDESGLVAFANPLAEALFTPPLPFVGNMAHEILPESLIAALEGKAVPEQVEFGGQSYRVDLQTLGMPREPRGWLLTLIPMYPEDRRADA